MLYRPNSLYSDGAAHMRHRQVVTETFARIDTHRLSRHVDRVADYLISQFNGRGRVDLVAGEPVPASAVTPAGLRERVARLLEGEPPR